MKQTMTASDLLRIYNNVMRRDYARTYMAELRAKKRAAKICPDCGVRHVEYRCRFCSECAEIRRQISNDISKHNQAMKKKGAAA